MQVLGQQGVCGGRSTYVCVPVEQVGGSDKRSAPALTSFCTDLCERARAGLIDPVRSWPVHLSYVLRSIL